METRKVDLRLGFDGLFSHTVVLHDLPSNYPEPIIDPMKVAVAFSQYMITLYTSVTIFFFRGAWYPQNEQNISKLNKG